MLTLCRKCHARIHRTYRPRYGFTGLLRVLWREMHPGLPEQRQLPIFPQAVSDDVADRPLAAQTPLFAT
jgi:hypothetical protein